MSSLYEMLWSRFNNQFAFEPGHGYSWEFFFICMWHWQCWSKTWRSLHCNLTKVLSQGRTEVKWRPGQETSLAPSCSKLKSIGRKCTVLKKILATLLGLFGARGILPPLSPHYAPGFPAAFLCFVTLTYKLATDV